MSANQSAPDVPCTLQTCPISYSTIGYQPNVGANAFYLILFATTLVANVFLGIRYRTKSYLVAFCCGAVLEVAGYAGRIQLHYDPFQFNFFVQYLVCLTIAPAFFSAAIYFTFHRVMLLFHPSVPRMRPKLYSIVFIISDLVCLILQATGGAIASLSGGSTSEEISRNQMGINIMIGGLSLQAASMIVFMVCAVDFWWRLYHRPAFSRYSETLHEGQPRTTALVLGLSVATVTIFIRSVFRVAELKDGFQSAIATNEVMFMILEGAMIVIACLCLTYFHPGVYFGRFWKELVTNSKQSADPGSNMLLKWVRRQS